jgi:hypothetical protein
MGDEDIKIKIQHQQSKVKNSHKRCAEVEGLKNKETLMLRANSFIQLFLKLKHTPI